ncbi:unnamed protein product [Auanema sp. JU1783]|nr:unnamed protein product [Auanema sp. JU1783]
MQEIEIEHLRPLKLFHFAIFPVPFNDKILKSLVKSPFSRVLVAKNGIIGCLCSAIKKIDGNDTLYIYSLGVHPCNREKGVGSSFMNYLEEEARKHGLSEIVLHVQIGNETAVKFYEKRGFVTRKEINNYYMGLDEGNALEMVKHIN